MNLPQPILDAALAKFPGFVSRDTARQILDELVPIVTAPAQGKLEYVIEQGDGLLTAVRKDRDSLKTALYLAQALVYDIAEDGTEFPRHSRANHAREILPVINFALASNTSPDTPNPAGRSA